MSLETFTSAYIETMLWADFYKDSHEDWPDDRTDIEISDEARKRIEADCASFYYRVEYHIEASIDKGEGTCGPDFDEYGHAGHDFYLTRNGHGAGFWDGDWPTHSEMFTKIAKGYGELNPYPGDDGKLYLA